MFFYEGSSGQFLDEFDWSVEQAGALNVRWSERHDYAEDGSDHLAVTCGQTEIISYEIGVEPGRTLAIEMGIVNNKTCQGLYNQLLSDARQVPFVFIGFGYNPGTNSILIPPARVAAALIGNANVYVLSSNSVIDEMNYHLGDLLRCEYGSIRVYQTNFDKSDPVNARLHRYLSSSFIAQHGEDKILRFLTDGLSRNGSTFRLSDFTSFTDIFAERRKYTIKKLATESHAKSEESSLLWDDNQQLRKDAATWESAATQFDAENAGLKKELATWKYRVEEADRVRHEIKDLESQIDGLKKLTSLPTTLSGVLKAVSSLFPTRLVITPEAITSADEYCDEHDGYWGKSEQLSIAWEMVFGVATRLHELVFVENSNRLEDAFSESFSHFELAMSEGKQTKKDAKLMALRQRVYDGKEIDISPHIKYGNRKPKMLRLYFAICRESGRFIIGQFGDHLDNYSTKKQ